MQVSTPDPIQPLDGAPDTRTAPEAMPYGPIGLAIGSLVIGALTILLCGLVVGAVFAVAVAWLGFQGALEGVVALKSAAGDETDFLIRIGVVASLVVYTAVVSAILIVARFRGGPRWRDIIALRPWTPFRGTRLYWALAVAAFVYNIAVSALISWLYPASKDWIETPSGTLWVAGFVLLAVVFAPIAEEMVFRGWLYTSLRRVAGVKTTIAITSVLFALAHWESTHLYALAVLPVGLVLGVIRHRTGTIAASITFHAVYNGAASVLLVLGR